MEENTEIFKYASKKTKLIIEIISIICIIISVILAIITLFNENYVIRNIFIIVFIVFIVVIFAIFCAKKNSELIKPIYIEGDKKITDVLVNHLKNTEKSLYYFGGAGFITEGDKDDSWARTLSNKLNDPKEIEVVRIIDLKKPYELEPLLRKMYGEKVDDQINGYRNWIKTHAKHLKKEYGHRISFYSYEGAPIWKHGMNYIVFDKKILALITPGTKEERKLAIIPNDTIAEEFADSITSVVKQFKLYPLTGKDLEEVYQDKTESSCCHT